MYLNQLLSHDGVDGTLQDFATSISRLGVAPRIVPLDRLQHLLKAEKEQ